MSAQRLERQLSDGTQIGPTERVEPQDLINAVDELGGKELDRVHRQVPTS